MHVCVRFDGDPNLRLEEAHDCLSLDVRVPAGHDTAEVAAVLRAHDAGKELDEEHLLLTVGWLRDAALSARPSSDPAEFDSMLEFAASRGWCTADGRHVRAHVQQEETK